MSNHGTADSVAGEELKQFIERIERLDEEIAGINGDKKDVYAEAKGRGFDVSIIREILRIRRQDPSQRAERETILDLYMQSIGMA